MGTDDGDGEGAGDGPGGGRTEEAELMQGSLLAMRSSAEAEAQDDSAPAEPPEEGDGTPPTILDDDAEAEVVEPGGTAGEEGGSAGTGTTPGGEGNEGTGPSAEEGEEATGKETSEERGGDDEKKMGTSDENDESDEGKGTSGAERGGDDEGGTGSSGEEGGGDGTGTTTTKKPDAADDDDDDESSPPGNWKIVGDEDGETEPQPQPQPPRRRRGRPKGSRNRPKEDEDDDDDDADDDDPEEEEASPSPPVKKRGRGRPRGSKDETKRRSGSGPGPGRPRKGETSEAARMRRLLKSRVEADAAERAEEEEADAEEEKGLSTSSDTAAVRSRRSPRRKKTTERYGLDSEGFSTNPEAVRKREARRRRKSTEKYEVDEDGFSTNPEAVRKREAHRRKKRIREEAGEEEWARDSDGFSTNPDAVYRRELRRKRREEMERKGPPPTDEHGRSMTPGAVYMRKTRKKQREEAERKGQAPTPTRATHAPYGRSMTPSAIRAREIRRRKREEAEDVAAEEDAKARGLSMTPGAIRSRASRRRRQREEEEAGWAAVEDAAALAREADRLVEVASALRDGRRPPAASDEDDDDDDGYSPSEGDEEEAAALAREAKALAAAASALRDGRSMTPGAARMRESRRKRREEQAGEEGVWARDEDGLSTNPDAVRRREAYRRRKRTLVGEAGVWGRDEDGLSTNPNAVYKREACRRRRRTLVGDEEEWARDSDGFSTNPDAVYRRELRRRRREEAEVFAVVAAEKGEEPPSGMKKDRRKQREKKKAAKAGRGASSKNTKELSMTPGAIRKREWRRRRREEAGDLSSGEEGAAIIDGRRVSAMEVIRKREFSKTKRDADSRRKRKKRSRKRKRGVSDEEPEEVTDPRVVGARVHAEVRHVLTAEDGGRLYAERVASKFLPGTVVHVEGGEKAGGGGGDDDDDGDNEEDREAAAAAPCLVTAVYRLGGDGEGGEERRRTLEVEHVRAGDPHPGWVADPRLIVGGSVHAGVGHVLTAGGEAVEEGDAQLYGDCAESKFIPGTVIDVEETTAATATATGDDDGDDFASSLFVTAVYRLGKDGVFERRVRLEVDKMRAGDPAPARLADARTIVGTPVHALATDVMGKEECIGRFGPSGKRLYLGGRVVKVEGLWNCYITAVYQLGEGEEEATARLMIHFVRTGDPPPEADLTERTCKTVDADGTRCGGWAGRGGWCHVHREDRCKADGCEGSPVYWGLCVAHKGQRKGTYIPKRCLGAGGCYNVAWGGTKLCRDHKDQIVPEVKMCEMKGCNEEAREFEAYCPHHAVRRCQVEGCGRNANARGGKCRPHGVEVVLCETEGCGNKAKIGGMCSEHRRIERASEVGDYKVFEMSTASTNLKKAHEEDPRRVVGNPVHAKAVKVLGTYSACHKLYGPLSSVQFLGGTVVEVGLGTGRYATKNTSCYITAAYELGNGETVTKRMNIRSVNAGDPPMNMIASPAAAAPTTDSGEASKAAASTTDDEDETNEPPREMAVTDETAVADTGKDSGGTLTLASNESRGKESTTTPAGAPVGDVNFTPGDRVYAQADHVVPSLYERIEIFGSNARLKLVTGTVTSVETVEGQAMVTAVYQLPNGEEEEAMRPAILVKAGVPSPVMLQVEKEPCRVVGAKVHAAVKLVLGDATDSTPLYLKCSASKFVPGTVVEVETTPSDDDPDLVLCFITAEYDLGGGVERRQRLALDYVYAGEPLPGTLPDPCSFVGMPVHALATDVLGDTECLRRFGPKNKTRYFGGTTVEVEENCFVTSVFQLGEGEEKRKRLNICFLKTGEPPEKPTKYKCMFVDSDGKRCERWRGPDGYCPDHRDIPLEKQCKADGCDRASLPGGFCRAHGEKKTPDNRESRKCSIPGCERLRRGGTKVCKAHKGSHTVAPMRICLVDGCNEEARRFGLRCTSHITNMDLCTVEGCHKWARQGGKCTTHGAKVKLCSVEGCEKMCKKEGKCTAHGAPRTVRLCEVDGCETQAYSRGRCCKHGYKTVCNVVGCKNLARQKGRCTRHGAQQARCKVDGCEKRAQYFGFCVGHGGKKLCDVEGCENNVALNGKCRRHCGLKKSYGRKCRVEGCEKFAKGGGKCIAHGGTRLRCQVEGCTKQAIQARRCIAHGGVEQRKKKRRKVSEAQDTYEDSSPGGIVGATEYESQPVQVGRSATEYESQPVQVGRSATEYESQSVQVGRSAAILWAAEASFGTYRGFS